MKKINLLAGETSSGSSSTTISNLGLIQLKPLLDIEPKNEIQELYPGDDGVSGYSFIRIKGVNNQDEKIVDASINTQEITPDNGYLGIKKVTVNGVDNTIDNNITADNIKHGVDILGVTGTYAPVTKPIEITPSTQEQVKVPDMGVDGFDSVTVHAVDKNIDSNIQAGNIRKGVEILGVTGEFGVELYDYDNTDFVKDTLVESGNYANPIEIPVPEGYSGFKSVKLYSVGLEGLTVNPSTNEQTFSKNPGEWYVGYNNVTVNPVTSSIDANIKPENIVKGVTILGVDGIAEKPADPTDQWNYDLLIHTTGNKAASFPQIVDEDGKQYLIFCNGNINLESCLYGFGYRTSYVRFSYHRYSADLFKKIGDFIYVDATTLGGVSNSDGIYVTYDFNDHNIPEKFYFNCGNGDSISVGTSCKKCGVDAFKFDNNDYVITRSFFEYNVNYIPNNLKKTTIDNIINKDQVRTIKICNEDNVINNRYPMYTDFDGIKYNGSNYNIGQINTKPAPRTGNNAENMYGNLSNCMYVLHPDTTQCTSLRGMYGGSMGLTNIYNLHEDSFINAENVGSIFAWTRLDQRYLPKKFYFNKSCYIGNMFQECPTIKTFPEIIMESDTCNLEQLCEGFGGDTINSPHKKDGTLCKAVNINYAFEGYNLSTIGEFDFSLITSPTVSEKDRVLHNSEKLVNLGGFIGLQVDIDLSTAVNLTHESLMNVINKAATVTGKKMIFGATNLAKLSEAEKQIAIDKGWTLE